MKYLTKDWYEICQRTGLHYGMRVHREAGAFSETLYQRLYRRKEKAHIQTQREVYNFDPRYFLRREGNAGDDSFLQRYSNGNRRKGRCVNWNDHKRNS